MSVPSTARARMVRGDDPVLDCSTLSDPDHASAYEMRIPDGGPSPEQWARTVFQDAPPVLRCFLVLGWQMVLRLRLAPVGSPDHVLGWTVQTLSPSSTGMGVTSPLMSVQKVVQVAPGRLVVATFVRFDRPAARLLWASVLPIHRLLEPALVTRAVARATERGS